MNDTLFVGLVIGLLSVMAAIPFVLIEANASPNGPVQIGPYYEAVGHINQAQSALQNGDTEGANNHLELAKQGLQE